MTPVLIRRPKAHEVDLVRAVVQKVVDEIYGDVWAPSPLPIGEEDWSLAWIAVTDGKIVGMVLTNEDWLSDLWVLGESRGRGIGETLLMRGEAEIARRGHKTSRLRVVKSNTAAVNFYLQHGWHVEREFPNERLPITMLGMAKDSFLRKD